MPRLSPRLVRRAQCIHHHLPVLLQECRDLSSATNELRWMKEALDEQYTKRLTTNNSRCQAGIPRERETQLMRWVKRRARHEPLQYILGTTPFGELDLKCRPEVLIPRVDTETWVTKLGELIRQWYGSGSDNDTLRIADFCTGSGCISLLLHSILRPPTAHSSANSARSIEIHGFDISPQALALSRENLEYNLNLKSLHLSARHEVFFHDLNVLELSCRSTSSIMSTLNSVVNTRPTPSARPVFDVVVSNPPYISPRSFRSTSLAVTKFEPLLALVPPPLLLHSSTDSDSSINKDRDTLRADQFYPALTSIALAVNAKMLVLEIGDLEQALRVVESCRELYRAHHGVPLVAAPESRDRGSECDELDARFEIWSDCGTARSLVDVRTGFDEEEFRPRAVVMWLDDRWMQSARTNSAK